jgi:WD40 repeat protein
MSGKELYNKAFDFKAKEGQFRAAVALSPNGKILAWARDRTIQLLDIENGKELTAQQDLAGTVYCLGFSPNGKTLASGGDDQCVQLWEIASAKLK